MYDTLSLLYELVIQKFPYEPRSPTEDGLLERLEQAQEKVRSCSEADQDLLFHLTDSMEILASFQAQHAFTLGLDLGLSLSRELSQFQETP